MARTVTHTRVHTEITFANPYLVCRVCGAAVTAWHDPDQCGCREGGWQIKPCGHQAEAVDTCPSWNPVDGCTCQETLGSVDHRAAPAPPPLR